MDVLKLYTLFTNAVLFVPVGYTSNSNLDTPTNPEPGENCMEMSDIKTNTFDGTI